MKKHTLLRIPVIILICFYPNLISLAGDCGSSATVPTLTGNHDLNPEMHCTCPQPFEIDEASTPESIAAGGSVSVYVEGGCPPYTYQVSGPGYSWGNESQSQSTNSTSAELSCNSGT